MVALNAEIENATLNVNLGSDDDSKRRNRECDSERQSGNGDDSKRRTENTVMTMALNTEAEE